MKRQLVRTRVMTLVHGKSEYLLCRHIMSNLHLKHEIIARDRGRTSIQINGLMDELNTKHLRNYKNFVSQYKDVEATKGKLLGFKLFILMDVEDCSDEMRRKYISGEMFKEHWLGEYIVPIYSQPNLEQTMKEAGIPITKNEKEKYVKIFPTNHGDLNVETAQAFRDKLRGCRCTNLEQFVDYCLELAQQRSIVK